MNNGRVNINGHNDVDRFLLYETQAVEKSTDYKNALVGYFEPSILSKAFFSGENIDLLQKTIILGVHKKSRGLYNIGYQDQDVLKTIMRAMYLQHSKNQPNNITSQVHELNAFVVNYAVPQIYNEAESYLKYKQQVSNIANPIDLPKSSYHSNTLVMKPFF
tara:strand:+ start:5673 stop:6155 length:483 start_codon:yes stop_codon:yes gene_type:complete